MARKCLISHREKRYSRTATWTGLLHSEDQVKSSQKPESTCWPPDFSGKMNKTTKPIKIDLNPEFHARWS